MEITKTLCKGRTKTTFYCSGEEISKGVIPVLPNEIFDFLTHAQDIEINITPYTDYYFSDSGSKIWRTSLFPKGFPIVISLSAYFRKLTILTINVGLTDVSDEGLKCLTVLASSLKGSNIVTLDLSNNKIGPKGAVILADVLPLTKIKNLELESNFIESEGAIALSNVLEHSKLQTLGLYENDIRSSGVKNLAKVIALPHVKLRKLYMRFNKFGNGGINALVKSLKTSNIKHISVYKNGAGTKETLKLLKEIMKTNIYTQNFSSSWVGLSKWDEDVKLEKYFDRNKIIQNFIRDSVYETILTLQALTFFSGEIIKIIAEHLLDTRRDLCWKETFWSSPELTF